MNDFIATKQYLVNATAPVVRRTLLNTRDHAVDLWARYRTLGGQPGSLPNFLIIGTQKGGTTHLYDELVKHPQILPALTKEVHFFDANFAKAAAWYRAFFPTAERLAANAALTGEASPSYLFHPHAPKRIRALLPDVKLIILLRNPVARAYSHYHHEVRLGYETLPFGEATACEEVRLADEYTRMLADERYAGAHYLHYSYLTRGRYVEQLHRWHAFFPNQQILTLKSEDFYANPTAILHKVLAFLGLPPIEHQQGRQHKAFPYAKLDGQIRSQLNRHFAPHNARLYEYLNQDYGWA